MDWVKIFTFALGQTLGIWFNIWIPIFIILGGIGTMYWYGKIRVPDTQSFQEAATILNSRGGNILILTVLSMYFFHRTELMYYIVMDKIKDNSITTDNGIALNGLLFSTGAFSGAMGALVKTMSPDAPAPAKPATTETRTQMTSSVTPANDKKLPVTTVPTDVPTGAVVTVPAVTVPVTEVPPTV